MNEKGNKYFILYFNYEIVLIIKLNIISFCFKKEPLQCLFHMINLISLNLIQNIYDEHKQLG